jgi:hypothetical protein
MKIYKNVIFPMVLHYFETWSQNIDWGCLRTGCWVE